MKSYDLIFNNELNRYEFWSDYGLMIIVNKSMMGSKAEKVNESIIECLDYIDSCKW